MKEDNIILQKSYAFAVRIVRLSQFLVKEKHAFQLADQVRRSGTSIEANMEEAVGGLSARILWLNAASATRRRVKLIIGYVCSATQIV